MPAKKRSRRDKSFEDFYKRKTSEMEGLGLTSYIGKAIQIGWDENNPRFVFFDTENWGWASNWDEKSYELAKVSYLHGKRLWIFADGEPAGENIKAAYLISG